MAAPRIGHYDVLNLLISHSHSHIYFPAAHNLLTPSSLSPRDSPINSSGSDRQPGPDAALPPSSTGGGATTTAELEATAAMCHHCFDVLVDALRQKKKKSYFVGTVGGWGTTTAAAAADDEKSTSSPRNKKKSRPEFVDHLPHDAIECPLFVTWDKLAATTNSRHHRHLASSTDAADKQQQQQQQQQFELRGCIGTLSPKPLVTSIGEYALISALRDRRFRPVQFRELPHLRVGVSLLVRYEPCEHCHDWVVGVHGIIVRWRDEDDRFAEYSATYLPEVAHEQGWDQKTAVESLVRKAGYRGRITDALLGRLQTTRYQSSKQLVTFEEYAASAKERGSDDDGDSLIATLMEAVALAEEQASSSSHQHGFGMEEDGKRTRSISTGCTIS